MTMPNGNGATPQPKSIVRGQHVAPGPMSFEATRRVYNLPTGPVTMVVLRFEHGSGTSEFVMASEFASQIGNAMIRAATGIEIARPGNPPT